MMIPRSLLIALVAGVLCLGSVHASPPRGSAAPPISLKDLDGKTVSTATLAGKTLVLVFGELNHEGAKQACADVLDVVADPRLAGEPVVPILIVARDVPAAQIKEEATQGRYPALILHDPTREAFGAYRVLVVPTLVVVDGKGIVVHSMPGYLQRSKDLLAEAILCSTGKISTAQFEQAIDPKSQSGASQESLKSDRLVHLGIELSKHGIYDTAEARFKEALALVPGHIGATLGLGDLMLKQDHLVEAEQYFRSLLTANPDLQDAVLGIATVQVRRGGESLTAAEATLKPLIEKYPKLARARFLMGQVHEKRGDMSGAVSEYRTAAELLLER